MFKIKRMSSHINITDINHIIENNNTIGTNRNISNIMITFITNIIINHIIKLLSQQLVLL